MLKLHKFLNVKVFKTDELGCEKFTRSGASNIDSYISEIYY